MKSFANGVRASGTGGDTAIIGPGSSKAHRDVSGSEIAEHHSREEGGDPVRPFLQECRMDGFQRFQTAKGRANVYADAVRSALRDDQPRVLDGFLSRSQGIMDKTVHAAQVAFVDVVLGSKVTHCRSDLRWILARVKAGNLADTRHPLTELLPDGINGEAQGGNRPKSSDHHTSLHGLLSLHHFPGWPSRTLQAVNAACESEYDVRTCALYTDSAQQYSMGVSRYQQTLAEKGLHIAPRLTRLRV